MQKGRATADKDVDLILSHQYNEGELSYVSAQNAMTQLPTNAELS